MPSNNPNAAPTKVNTVCEFAIDFNQQHSHLPNVIAIENPNRNRVTGGTEFHHPCKSFILFFLFLPVFFFKIKSNHKSLQNNRKAIGIECNLCRIHCT
jgi:hypothetical protein